MTDEILDRIDEVLNLPDNTGKGLALTGKGYVLLYRIRTDLAALFAAAHKSDYEDAAMRLALEHMRKQMFPCQNCGHPVVQSRICTNCKDGYPNSPLAEYQAPPEYRADAPVPPARDEKETYRQAMRLMAKHKPHLIGPLRLEEYVEQEEPKQ